MKYTNAITLAMAPLALAKSVRNKHPANKRDPSFGGVVGGGVGLGGVAGFANVPVVQGVLLLWTNMGGGAQPNIVNSQVTVTQTVTVAAGAAPTAIAGVDGVTTTVNPGATGVVAGTGATHSVTVGGPQGLSFFPGEIEAAVGDMIIFNFMAQNHTVTQSAFDTPCVALEGGMDSGFMPNADNAVQPPPQVAMQVMTGEPLWMYCAQGNHCGQGMVFSINPTIERTHAQFQSLAISQNGQNPGTAITGGAPPVNDPAAVAPPADPLADPNLIADPNMVMDPNQIVDPLADPNQVFNDPIAAPTFAADPLATGSVATGALNGGIVMGVGTLNADGSCQCAVQCDLGAGAGAGALQAGVGQGGFGGVAGVLPGSVNAASIDPLGAASVDPLGAASVDPLGAATVDATEATPLADPLVARRN